MAYYNHQPYSYFQQGSEGWCCTAHCEEHSRLSMAYEATDSKVAALRNKVIQTILGKPRTTQEASIALDKVNEWVDAITEGINVAQKLHDKFCGGIAIDAHTSSISMLKTEREDALEVLLKLRKEYKSLEIDHARLRSPPRYTPVDPMKLPSQRRSSKEFYHIKSRLS
ncbi:hypothetical protein QCA50_019563 [Cerrena zonata]|uniref:Uncharacterized protein n=1 Tax=Cerrena zonata TaxID=2478898 RepID=A0AAW0FEH2_9APHY